MKMATRATPHDRARSFIWIFLVLTFSRRFSLEDSRGRAAQIHVIPVDSPRQRSIFRARRCDNPLDRKPVGEKRMNDRPGEGAGPLAEDLLQRSDEDGVATLVLSRPRQYNALSRA